MRVRGALSDGDAGGGVFEHGGDDGNRRAVGRAVEVLLIACWRCGRR